jgi:hypothetical protein
MIIQSFLKWTKFQWRQFYLDANWSSADKQKPLKREKLMVEGMDD